MLQLDDDGYTIKKGNSYTCISTPKYKFLDITEYLAAGTSYDSFLKAYHCQQAKGHFPYEWFDSVDKLQTTVLPPYAAFYSRLKEQNTLEMEKSAYDKMLSDGCTEAQVLKKLHLDAPPKTGEEKYEDLQRLWTEEGMETFEHFLKFYNNADVLGFIEALEKVQGFYKQKQVDMFKQAISCPGISRILMMRAALEAGESFPLFDEDNKDLHQLFKDNVVGGPSIIFNRFHKAGVTKIRGGSETCQKVRDFKKKTKK